MPRYIIALIIVLQPFCCLAQDESIPSMTFNQLTEYLEKKENKTVVVNFWATWCRPCIAELPYFEEARAAYRNQGVEVVLVSMDFSVDKAASYASRKGLQSEVIFLDETNHNSWIPKIAPEWSGALPATLVLNNGSSSFHEGEINKNELEQLIESNLN